MDYRIRKQITISIIVILFLALVGVGVYYTFLKPGPTCFDNIKNQDEEEIDCGGTICQSCETKTIKNIEVVWVDAIPVSENIYDLVAKIRNPNPNYGAANLAYSFELKNSSGQTIGKKDGSTFILPNSTKYIIENNFKSSEAISLADLKTNNKEELKWQKLKDYQSLELFVLDKRFDILNDINFWGQASGTVKNSTTFGFDKVSVNVVVFDKNSKPIGAAKTEMRTLTAGEYRAFSVGWPNQFASEVASTEMQAETNLFLDENFMQVYGAPEEP